MFSNHIARAVHIDRQREIERRLRLTADVRERSAAQLSVRRRVGYRLIRIGSALASDGPLQLAARR